MAPPPTAANPQPTGNVQPPSAEISQPVLIALVIRGVTFLLVLISLIILGTNTVDGTKFSDFSAYSYMFSSGIIGIIYTFFQIGLKISHLTTGNQSGLHGWDLIDFYGDKVLSYVLATGAAAGFGLTVDLNRSLTNGSSSFLDKANASASLLFIAFIFSAVSSVLSSFALSKRS